MFNKLEEATKIFIRNFTLFSQIILTVWLPISIGLTVLTHFIFPDLREAEIIKISVWLQAGFTPIYAGALIFALDKIKRGINVNYNTAMTHGKNQCYKLLQARLSTGIIVLLGLIAFIIPGIILGLRFSLVDEIVVLENMTGKEARKLSAKLTKGKKRKIFTATLLASISIGIFGLILSAFVHIPFILLGQTNNFLIEIVLDCSTHILGGFVYILIFLFYWDSKKIMANSEQ